MLLSSSPSRCPFSPGALKRSPHVGPTFGLARFFPTPPQSPFRQTHPFLLFFVDFSFPRLPRFYRLRSISTSLPRLGTMSDPALPQATPACPFPFPRMLVVFIEKTSRLTHPQGPFPAIGFVSGSASALQMGKFSFSSGFWFSLPLEDQPGLLST